MTYSEIGELTSSESDARQRQRYAGLTAEDLALIADLSNKVGSLGWRTPS